MLLEQEPQPSKMLLCRLLTAFTSLLGQAATVLKEAASPNKAVHASASGSGATLCSHKINCFFYLEKRLCQLPSPVFEQLAYFKIKNNNGPSSWRVVEFPTSRSIPTSGHRRSRVGSLLSAKPRV
ncbi:hypothetical protein H8957_008136, partial [Semnopithecus entellus]